MDGAPSHPESIPPQPPPGVPAGTSGGRYQTDPLPYPEYGPASYPAALPPAVQYPAPQRNTKRPLLIIAAIVAAIAALVGGIVFAVNGSDSRGGLSAAGAKSAIQGYLDALQKQDKETVARHALCGLYDAVKDHAVDLVVANLASDAFRRQYSQAQVTSIDKIVALSSNQAQVLFTMKVTPTERSPRGSSTKDEIQAVAQILVQKREALVCSYLPRPSDSL